MGRYNAEHRCYEAACLPQPTYSLSELFKNKHVCTTSWLGLVVGRLAVQGGSECILFLTSCNHSKHGREVK